MWSRLKTILVMTQQMFVDAFCQLFVCFVGRFEQEGRSCDPSHVQHHSEVLECKVSSLSRLGEHTQAHRLLITPAARN